MPIRALVIGPAIAIQNSVLASGTVGELWNGEQFLKNLQRASLMDQHFRSFGIGSDRYRLYRQWGVSALAPAWTAEPER